MLDVRAVYAGSFDPPTLGHLNIIEKAVKLFSTVIVGIGTNYNKTPMFNRVERVSMMRSITKHLRDQVIPCRYTELTVQFARARKATVMIRSMRTFTDYEDEIKLALINKRLAPELETVFIMPSMEYQAISSSAVKEIFKHGQDIRGLVPELVIEKMEKKRDIKKRKLISV